MLPLHFDCLLVSAAAVIEARIFLLFTSLARLVFASLKKLAICNKVHLVEYSEIAPWTDSVFTIIGII